jgi:arylsulfatase A-like enzyme
LVGSQHINPYRVNDDGDIRTATENHSVLFEEEAEAFVRARNATRPWFCYLNFTDPHLPYTPPSPYSHTHDGARFTSPGTKDMNASDNPYARRRKKYAQRTLDRAYEGTLEELELVDARVRRICTALQETGQMTRTLIFYSSDNGFMLGEHGGMMNKSHPYEESVRVPFLVRGPGIPRSVPALRLVSHLDITYTILAAAGADLSGTDGRDLRRINSRSWRKRLLIEHPGRHWASVREGNKMLFNIDTDREGDEYYRLGPGDDPYQRHSLHNDPAYAAEMAGLAPKLSALRTAAGDNLRALEVA